MTPEELLRASITGATPCVLFLGQSTEDSGPTSVLAQLLRRKGLPPDLADGWRGAIARGISAEDYEWLTERFERTVASEAYQQALDLPWSAVFTSAIDPRLLRRLETRGRNPEAIVTSEQRPRAPRSTARPPVYYLFGRSSDTADGSRCPHSVNELARRRTRHSGVLLARVPETATSVGLLVIDQYAEGRDWLPADTLLSAIPPHEGMRVLWFGADASAKDSPLFRELEESGTLIADTRTLTQVVAEMRAAADFAPATLPLLHQSGLVTCKGGATVEISPSLRLRVEASASIVDDEWTKPADPVSPAAEEDLFRTIHGDFGGPRALVEGVIRGFFVTRSFERDLQAAVSAGLEKAAARDRVIVIHGQSGTGKSVAIARLAVIARRQHGVPVLIAAGRVPDATDVDSFCEEIERAGQGPTVVLCDANEAFERYLPLADALRSRGRKFLLVGTSYRQDPIKHRGIRLVEAPETSATEERESLSQLLSRFSIARVAGEQVAADGANVFALLYRGIAASRPRLASGLGGEARFVESALRQRAREQRPTRPKSALALKLVAAGLHKGEETLLQGVEEAVGDHGAPGRLIDYVMVAGRIDVGVPLNLLMRALRTRVKELDFDQIADLFGGLDLFRWRPGNEERTELLVCARLRLEAELICRRRVGGTDREVECLVDLIEAVRPSGVDEDSELRFLLDLLQRVDRDGPRGKAYAAGYRRIAEALTTLRVSHGIEDASLMLQESNFRRAWLWADGGLEPISANDRDLVLDQARSVVEEALGKVERRQLRAGKRTRENLFVERASIYGFLAVGHAKAGSAASLVWSDYQAARVAARRAMNVAPSYFPFDVALWTPADILQEANETLSSSQRADLVADVYATLDRVSPSELAPGQLEKFHKRREKVGHALDDSRLQEGALQDLERVNPQAALFLRARKMCLGLFDADDEVLSDAVRSDAKRAADYLQQRLAIATSDPRCLRALLEFQWATSTGRRLLRGERQPTPSDRATLVEIQRTVGLLLGASGDAPESSVRFLSGVLAWLHGDTREAESLWKTLSQETEFEDRRRVVRRLLVTDAEGRPKKHRGRLVEARTKGHWLVELEGTGTRVDLLERDFSGLTFRSGGEVRDFSIAFNYLGALAEMPLARGPEGSG